MDADEIPKTIPIKDRDDPFVIEAVIGEGGMGKVYRARDPVTGDLLAVKVLGEVGDPTRFALESDILSRLQHPNIVGYRGHGLTKSGHPYLAMEWVDGDDLEKHLETSNLTVEEALRIGRAVTDALAAAHEAGVIHRDLKPSNVILTRERRAVKLVDFGIARAAHVDGLTRTDQALGTPGYMSPEQARGHAVDARTDLFSLGCLLFRALGGRRPFAGSDIMQFATSLALESPPPLRELAPLVPPDLEALVARLLQKDPALRPESARSVRKALDRIGAGADRTALAPTAEGPSATSTLESDATVAAVPAPAGTPRATGMAAVETRRSSEPAKRNHVATIAAGVVVLAALLGGSARLLRRTDDTAATHAPIDASVADASVANTTPVRAIDRALLDRACRAWAAAILKGQRADGSFSGEERGPPSGWDTAQQLFALAEGRRACDGAPIAALGAGARALTALRVDGGWIGPRRGPLTKAETVPETPAIAWAALAFDSAGRATKDPATTDAAVRARADLLRARNADGGFRVRPPAKGASALYATTLAAWALGEAQAPEASAAFEWLAAAIAAGTPGTAEAGFTEELAWVTRREAKIQPTLASMVIAHCRPDANGACSRAVYDTGRVPFEADAGGALVTPWHPWATLAASTLARESALGAETTRTLDAISRWGAAELTASIDVLGAAPAYKLSEYLIAVAELLRGP